MSQPVSDQSENTPKKGELVEDKVQLTDRIVNSRFKATSHPRLPVPADREAIFQAVLEEKQPTTNKEVSPLITKKNRCSVCRKKLSLVQQTSGLCACGITFCDKHRYASKHNCDYDYKTPHKEQLKIANPKVVRSQLNRC